VGRARVIVSLLRLCGTYPVVPTEIERLYREHRAGLVRLVERELHDHHEAEDVVQTAFLDAQRALDRGTIPRNPRAWLAAIALNTGRRLRRRRLNAEPLEEYAAQEASETPEIRAALARLPREQRAAVVYRDVLGLSYGETAEQMGTSVNAVTMLLYRGRRRLRQTLGVTAGGIGLWRGLRRAGMPQVALAKGTAAIVVAAGLATTGAVAARVLAPVGSPTTAAAAPAPHPVTPSRLDPTRPHHTTAGYSRAEAVPASTRGSGGAVTPVSVGSSPADTAAPSSSPSTLAVPTVSVPTVPVPTSPATVTVATPVTAVTVTTPTGTTATVTTPITTVTVPIP
jgi:RNA polymerase sigma-70 factor (ECF subfamily)